MTPCLIQLFHKSAAHAKPSICYTAPPLEVPTVTLALFDLDNTLLATDSDNLWGEYVAAHLVADGDHYQRENARYQREYEAGTLDIRAFLRFALRVLAETEPSELERLRGAFLHEHIFPQVAAGAHDLIERHRRAGDHLIIITATNRFVTEPIAEFFGVDTLIATEPEQIDGRYTGEVVGTPCFRSGKIERLYEVLGNPALAALPKSTFYSDSHNDVPLLERVGYPVAVDPDTELEGIARERAWPIISLRSTAVGG